MPTLRFASLAGTLFFGLILSQCARSSDWQFAGATDLNSAPTLVFFDAESIQQPSPGVIRVWTKAMSLKALDRHWAKKDKALIDLTARKVAVYYVPSYFLLDPIKKRYTEKEFADQAITYTGYEVVANAIDVPILHKVLFEIDCTGRRIRAISFVAFKPKGKIESSDTLAQPYGFISPDSNGEWLRLLVCPQPK